MPSPSRLIAIALLLGGTASCTSPSVTGTIEGEPVCPDFQLGEGSLLKGSLKKPVQVSVLDGDTVRWERVLLGKRKASDPNSKFVVEDDDETYTIHWAQCPNTFAPKRVSEDERDADVSTSYSCGEAEIYKKQELKVRQGEASSRVLQWIAPPEPSCWNGTAADPAASASASASAEEEDEPPDAGTDASTSASASASASASSPPPPAPEPAPKTLPKKAPPPQPPPQPPAPAPAPPPAAPPASPAPTPPSE